MASDLSNNFSARTIMRADTAGGPVRWANVHEFDATGWTGDLFLNQVALFEGIAAFHQSLLSPAFWVESVTISSAAEDGRPYDPETLFTRTAMLRGTRGIVANQAKLLPLVNVLHVKKAVSAGREGNMLLRGFLTEEDIQSDPLTGAVTLVEFSAIQTEVSQAWATLNTALSTGGAKMVLMKVVDGTVSQVREVSGLLAKGVTAKKLNNKYFDKGSSPLAGLYEGLVEQYGPAVVGNIVEYLIGSGGTVPPLLP